MTRRTIYEVTLKSDEDMGAQFNYSPYGVDRENIYYTTWHLFVFSDEIRNRIENDPQIASWKILDGEPDFVPANSSANEALFNQWLASADASLLEKKEYSWLTHSASWMREKAKQTFGGEVAWLMQRLDDLDSSDLTSRDMELFEKLQSLSPEAFGLLMARQKWGRDQEPVTFTTLDYLDWISNGK